MLKKLVVALSMLLGGLSLANASVTKIIITSPPGGASYLIGMQISEILKAGGIPAVVEPRPGAQGMIATTFVAKQADAATLLILPSGPGLYAPLLEATRPYDVLQDLEPVIAIGTQPSLLIVPQDSPFRNVNDLVKAMKTSRDQLRWGWGGVTHQVFGMRFLEAVGTKAIDVPHQGGGQVALGVAGNHFEFGVVDPGSADSLVKAGKIRILAVGSAKRSSLLPDVPTFIEQGVNFEDTGAWFVLMAPRSMPADTINKINQLINDGAMRSDPNHIRTFTQPLLGTPQQARQFVQEQYRVMAPVISKLRK